jgi:hypothetical protein
MRNYILWLCWVLLGAALNLSAADSPNQPGGASTASPKSFQIRNHKFGNLLRPEDANNADGTPIVLYPDQPWKCMTWTFHPSGGSSFQLENRFTSKTFAAKAADTQTQATVAQVPFAKNFSDRPTWQFTKLPDGTYKITDPKSGKVMTAVKEENTTRCRIVITAWYDGDDQKWDLSEIDPKVLTM